MPFLFNPCPNCGCPNSNTPPLVGCGCGGSCLIVQAPDGTQTQVTVGVSGNMNTFSPMSGVFGDNPITWVIDPVSCQILFNTSLPSSCCGGSGVPQNLYVYSQGPNGCYTCSGPLTLAASGRFVGGPVWAPSCTNTNTPQVVCGNGLWIYDDGIAFRVGYRDPDLPCENMNIGLYDAITTPQGGILGISQVPYGLLTTQPCPLTYSATAPSPSSCYYTFLQWGEFGISYGSAPYVCPPPACVTADVAGVLCSNGCGACDYYSCSPSKNGDFWYWNGGCLRHFVPVVPVGSCSGYYIDGVWCAPVADLAHIFGPTNQGFSGCYPTVLTYAGPNPFGISSPYPSSININAGGSGPCSPLNANQSFNTISANYYGNGPTVPATPCYTHGQNNVSFGPGQSVNNAICSIPKIYWFETTYPYSPQPSNCPPPQSETGMFSVRLCSPCCGGIPSLFANIVNTVGETPFASGTVVSLDLDYLDPYLSSWSGRFDQGNLVVFSCNGSSALSAWTFNDGAGSGSVDSVVCGPIEADCISTYSNGSQAFWKIME